MTDPPTQTFPEILKRLRAAGYALKRADKAMWLHDDIAFVTGLWTKRARVLEEAFQKFAQVYQEAAMLMRSLQDYEVWRPYVIKCDLRLWDAEAKQAVMYGYLDESDKEARWP